MVEKGKFKLGHLGPAPDYRGSLQTTKSTLKRHKGKGLGDDWSLSGDWSLNGGLPKADNSAARAMRTRLQMGQVAGIKDASTERSDTPEKETSEKDRSKATEKDQNNTVFAAAASATAGGGRGGSGGSPDVEIYRALHYMNARVLQLEEQVAALRRQLAKG